ncbi:MAG: SRPBCC family protein [Chloroflexi bacterium]|nr:SRPBCC family protein [Chloroflexota bacterium]
MNHFQMETRVEAPVEHVWAFMCDRSHLEDWTRARASDVSGPLDQVGTTFVQTSRTLGFEMKGTLTVLEVEPMRLLHLRSDMGPDMVFRFAPEGDATHLTFETDYEMPGHIPGFVKNLMTKSYVERQMRRGMEDIKAFAEATVPAHA